MREEDPKARVDRELIELLNELRMVIPGVQVLFAFLLILPFTGGLASATHLQRGVYFFAFSCTAAATALLIAPTSYHRLRFRQHDKERMLFTSNTLAIAGTVFVALAITSVVFLVTDQMFRVRWASVVAAVSAAWFSWLWYGLPLSRRGTED